MTDILEAIRRRVGAASPAPWVVEREHGSAFIRTGRPGTNRLFLRRDDFPASEDDVEFVAAARNALPGLIARFGPEGSDAITESELEALDGLVASASPGPWIAHTERSGPIGGSSMIWVDGLHDARDLYVWLGDEIAPDADIEFIAHSRQDVPRLIPELRKRTGQ